MARGFESKDVEFQQAEAERRARAAASPSAASAADRDRLADRRTLELALSRARSEQAATTSPVRREVLAHMIEDLEARLAALADPAQ